MSTGAALLDDAVAARTSACESLARSADTIVAGCYDTARRLARGGTLIVFGTGALAADAQHIAVEFMHPVIVGKRALPAMSLAADVATVTGIAVDAGLDEVFAAQLPLVAGPGDVALGLSTGGDGDGVRRGLEVARRLGLLTLGVTARAGTGAPLPAEHVVTVDTDDPRIVKEVVVTYYHLLWELVHVCFEQADLVGDRP